MEEDWIKKGNTDGTITQTDRLWTWTEYWATFRVFKAACTPRVR